MKHYIKDALYLLNIFRHICKNRNISSKLQYNTEALDREFSLLCNGPSLKDVLPRVGDMHNQDFGVVNFFGSFKEFKIVKPKVYCLCDPMFFMDIPENSKLAQVKEIFQILDNDVDWDMKLIIPVYYKKLFKEFAKISNPHIDICCANLLAYPLSDKLNFWLYKKNWSCPAPQTVAIPVIYAAINMGYKTIRLYGVDHTFMKGMCVNDNNELCMTFEHFYDDKVELKPVVTPLGKHPTIAEELQTIVNIFDSHQRLERYSKHMGCKIWNHTRGSFIDAYERKYD